MRVFLDENHHPDGTSAFPVSRGIVKVRDAAPDIWVSAGLEGTEVLIAFHKPCGVLSRFTPDGSPNRTLAEFGFPKGVHPIGRLDADSEGLLLLSDEADLNARLLNPREGHPRRYWAQVERIPSEAALDRLRRGVVIQGYRTRRCEARILEPRPEVAPRDPPIRYRKAVPDCWIELVLTEGKNRQVRRMTAAAGHPTLRLIRVAIGEFRLEGIAPGSWREAGLEERKLLGLGAEDRRGDRGRF